MRAYQITVRNKAAAVVIGATALLVVGALVAVGLTLVVGLAVGGAVLGAGTRIIRRLTGGTPARPLDPTPEVFLPPTPTDARRQIGPPD